MTGLRALFALGVVIHHTEQGKYLYLLPGPWLTQGMQKLGANCVTFFFVLSGFLITYLLLEEKKTFGSLSVKDFYIRRCLRIWPLYYIIVLLGLFILPGIHAYDVPTYPPVWDKHFAMRAAIYLALSAQVACAFVAPAIVYAGVLWSVGVEEWFYAIWPWVLKQSRRFEIWFLLTLIVGLNIGRWFLHGKFYELLYMTRFDCMAVGGLLAILLQNKEKPKCRRVLDFVYRSDVQLFCYVTLAVCLAGGNYFGRLNELLYSILIGAIIVNLASNAQSILSLETPLLRWLGEISYGLYCYNWIAVVTAAIVLRTLAPGISNEAAGLIMTVLGPAITIFMSDLSYRFIESKFLKLKAKFFTRITSGSDVLPAESEATSPRPQAAPAEERGVLTASSKS